MLATAIVGVVTSVVSAFYYLRVVLVMFMRDTEGEVTVRLRPALAAALAVTATGTFVLGIIPTPLFQLARSALLAMAG